MRLENRTTASGSSLASATASASRLSAPTGVLSSWLTLATKSRRIGLDPLLAGAVVGEHEDQPGAERGDAGVDV